MMLTNLNSKGTFSACIWYSASHTRYLQSDRVLEAEWAERLSACSRSDQRPGILLCPVRVFILCYEKHILRANRVIFCSIFAILADRFDESTSVAADVFTGLGSPTLLCILGNHMLFNLKEAAEHGVNVGTNWASYSHSTIGFDEPHHGISSSEFVKTACIRL